MAAAAALADRYIIANVLHQLSDMKYKDRRQRGPYEPVELLEFRPTLVPAILVNKSWADEGTSVLWKRYPHLPALRDMQPARRQFYADKVEQIFSLGPPPGAADSLNYLENLEWPKLRSLELEVDFIRHGANFKSLLHAQLEHLELSGRQSGSASYFADVALPSLLQSSALKSLRFGPGIFGPDNPVHASVLYQHLDAIPSIQNVELRLSGFSGVDDLFTHLSQRADLEGLELDLEPGLGLLPQLEGPNALPTPFASLKRLSVMCYPEIAMSLIPHLSKIEALQLDLCRIPEKSVQRSDYTVLDDLVKTLTHCPKLKSLKVGIGALAHDFPGEHELPGLNGESLVSLATSCMALEELALFANEPSGLNALDIQPDHFDTFCRLLPQLQVLSLKFAPHTTYPFEGSILQSLGAHCPILSVLRLKMSFPLPTLPIPPSSLPQILVSTPGTPSEELADALQTTVSTMPPTPTEPLFPQLTHLALSRPETVLWKTPEISGGPLPPEVDPEVEEALVRAWARPLAVHFPRLEILEAWGDWSREDTESLNYFLPTEEILASTWEFLSGAEQNLWEDDADDDSYETYNGSGEDWDAASYLNEYTEDEDPAFHQGFVEEPEGMVTPGRTIQPEGYFDNFEQFEGGAGIKTRHTHADSVIQVDANIPIIPPSHELDNIHISQ